MSEKRITDVVAPTKLATPSFTEDHAFFADRVVFLLGGLAFTRFAWAAAGADGLVLAGCSDIQSKEFGKVLATKDLGCRRFPLCQRTRDRGLGDQLFLVDTVEPEKEFRLFI